MHSIVNEIRYETNWFMSINEKWSCHTHLIVPLQGWVGSRQNEKPWIWAPSKLYFVPSFPPLILQKLFVLLWSSACQRHPSWPLHSTGLNNTPNLLLGKNGYLSRNTLIIKKKKKITVSLPLALADFEAERADPLELGTTGWPSLCCLK